MLLTGTNKSSYATEKKTITISPDFTSEKLFINYGKLHLSGQYSNGAKFKVTGAPQYKHNVWKVGKTRSK